MAYEQALQIQIELQATGSTVLAQFEQLIKFEEALYGTSALEKWQSFLAKNQDLNFIRDNCAVFLYGPLTSCAVERLFSILKSKLDNCTNVKSETIYKHLFMRIN